MTSAVSLTSEAPTVPCTTLRTLPQTASLLQWLLRPHLKKYRKILPNIAHKLRSEKWHKSDGNQSTSVFGRGLLHFQHLTSARPIKRDNVRILDDFRLMSRLLTFKSSMQIRAKWANHTLMDLAKGNTRKIHQSGSVNHSSRIWRNQKSSGDFSSISQPRSLLESLTTTKKSCDYAFNHLYQRLGFPGHLEKVLLPERPCAQCRDCPETGSTSATGVGWWLMIFCPLQCQKWHKRKCFKKKGFLWKRHIMIFIFKSVSAWNFVLKTCILSETPLQLQK